MDDAGVWSTRRGSIWTWCWGRACSFDRGNSGSSRFRRLSATAWRSSVRGGRAWAGARRASPGSCGRSAGGARGWGAVDEDQRRGRLARAPASKENGRTPVLAGTGRRRSESGGRGARSGLHGNFKRQRRQINVAASSCPWQQKRERIERKKPEEGEGREGVGAHLSSCRFGRRRQTGTTAPWGSGKSSP